MHFQSTYYKNVNNFWTNFSVIVLIFCITRRWISFSIKYHKCVLKPLDPECSSLVEDGLAFVLSQHISLYVSYTRLLHISACHSICPYTVWKKNIVFNHFGWIFSIGSASTHRIPEQSLPCTFYPPWPWHSFSTYQGSHSHQHIKVIIVLYNFSTLPNL